MSRPRSALAPHEAAFVLGLSEAEVRRRLSAGDLQVEWRGRALSVEVDSLLAHPEVHGLARLVLEALIDGRIRAPRARRRSERPPPRVSVTDELWGGA